MLDCSSRVSGVWGVLVGCLASQCRNLARGSLKKNFRAQPTPEVVEALRCCIKAVGGITL